MVSTAGTEGLGRAHQATVAALLPPFTRLCGRRQRGRARAEEVVDRGRHDMCTDPLAATLVNGIKRAREVVLEDSSHTPVLEQTDEYLDAISHFMREAETR